MIKVSLIAAVSADGFIARSANQPTSWTSKEDKKVFVSLTKRAGVMVMGGATFRTIGRALPARKNIVYSRTKIDEPDIETTQEQPAQLLDRLQKEGYKEVAICGGAQIYDMFLRAGLVTDIYMTVEPVLFGSGLTLATHGLDISLSLEERTILTKDTMLLHYIVQV